MNVAGTLQRGFDRGHHRSFDRRHDRDRPRRRVRHEVRDGLGVVAFSVAASTAVAALMLLLTGLAG